MNWYSIFYWLTVADGVKDFFDSFSNIFTFLAIVSGIIWAVLLGIRLDTSKSKSEEEVQSERYWVKLVRGVFIWMTLLSFITWGGYMFTPTKKDALLIVAGGGTMEYLSNDSLAKEIPHEVMSFVTTELKSMAADAKVEIGISNQKDKVLESVKGLTGEQLIEKMRNDSNLVNIIMEK